MFDWNDLGDYAQEQALMGDDGWGDLPTIGELEDWSGDFEDW
jgi:hypothetical protein